MHHAPTMRKRIHSQMSTIKQQVIDAFSTAYGEFPQYLVRAPGRVNLIGEHTDYNDGFVLPMAIERAIWIALRPRTDRTVEIKVLDFDETIQFSLNQIERGEPSPAEYMKGVAHILMDAGYDLNGWEGVVKGDVPVGAGLSSSAALEMATAQAFAAVSGFQFDPPKMAKLGQRVENEWIGVQSGIMDQMISAAGEAGSALLIDCRSLETELAPLPDGTVVVIMDTGTRRGLIGSAYNERRQQCEAAAAFYDVPKLRDVDIETFKARMDELDELPRRRTKHVITENDRTLKARDAMHNNDPVVLGALMDASHVSMRDDFEISSDALNAMVEAAHKHPASYGARMTGGGFAGCAVALVKADQVDSFVETVSAEYQTATGNTPALYVSQPAQGTSIISD